MVDDAALREWFRREVMPHEHALAAYIRRNWRVADDVMDLLHDVYEQAIAGARNELPLATRRYLFTVARNHLINRAKRAKIIPFELVADFETIAHEDDIFEAERQLDARDALRQVQEGLEKLTPRVRQIIRLRKIDGLNIRETAERLGISSDAVRQQTVWGMRALTSHMAGGRGRIVRKRFFRRSDGGEA